MRIDKTLRNTKIGIVAQLLGLILNFLTRTVFIYFLGIEYLGITSMFTSLLAVLSIAELGIGSAIVYSLYRPLAENDKEKIKVFINLQGKLYKRIGIFIALLSLIIFPFLELITEDSSEISNLELIYILFVLNSVIPYFFSHKRSILLADQIDYINTINRYTFLILQYILQIVILILTSNFILFLIVQIGCTLISNIAIHFKTKKIYPYLNEKSDDKLSSKEKKSLIKHISAMTSHKLGSIVVNSTDILLISFFIGINTVGLYSNYILIINTVKTIFEQFYKAIMSSVGNLYVTESREKASEIYSVINFIALWSTGLISICLYFLINPFITLWIGKDYVFENSLILILVLNFYMFGIRQPQITFNTAFGLFWIDRYKPIIEALINLVASIYLLSIFGLIGVIWGTFISSFFVCWIEPYILYKYGLKKPVKTYVRQLFVFLIATFSTGSLLSFIMSYIDIETWFVWFCLSAILIIFINAIFLFVFQGSKEFNYVANIVKGKIIKRH